jgi:hypothetical protein
MSQNLRHGISSTNLFTKLFPELQPFSATVDELRLLANLMRDPTLRLPSVDNRNYAGLTYLGQFIDHDITREKNTVLGNSAVNTNTLINERTSWFDLDSVYGDNNSLLNAQGLFDFSVNQFGEEDLPRNSDGTAIIGDPRNEENLIIAELHFVFLKFHNKVMQDLQLANPTMLLPQLISQAQKIVQWHYQFIIVNEFVKEISGKYFSRIFDVNTSTPIVHPAIKNIGAKIPLEFNGACYRFGHSNVRDGYYINDQFDIFPLFDPVLPDLTGFKPRPVRQVIDWSMFFPMPFTKGFQEWEGIDPFVVNSLFQLPGVVATGEPILPLRSMIRGTMYGLPSGQDLARALGVPEEEILSVSKGSLVFQTINGVVLPQELEILNLKFGESTPLFYYILMEAWVFGNGDALGPLGSLVVGGVILNLLQINQDSYLNNAFSPTAGLFGCITTGEYYFTELITYALDLRPYTPADIIPDLKTNFFDQHSVNQFSVAQGRVHPLQPTIQPNLIPEIPVTPFPGYQIDQFDPTLILGMATQEEVNIVATNAVANGFNSVYAVVKFIANKNIEAIALGLLAPFGKKVPRPIVNTPFVLPDDIPIPVEITQSQLRGRALTQTLNESLRFTVEEANAILLQVQEEINNALTGTPVINLTNFINGDILV